MFFSFFPPEIISGMMYSGPGSGPLAASATAWDGLASDLYATAASYESVIATLTSGWTGPSAMAMTAAAVPYVSWMGATAAAAAEAGAQAGAAVGAFETAFATTVPPPVIATNRALLAALIASNIFGQNTPAIAATEADYLEMWAQDVGAMNGYAASAAGALQTPPFSAPPAMTNPAATLTPLLTSSGAGALSALTTLSVELQATLGSLTTSAPVAGFVNATGLGSLASGGGLTQASIYPIEGGYYAAMMGSIPARMFMSMGNSAGSSGMGLTGSQALFDSIGQFVSSKMQVVVGGISNQLKSWGGSISAQLASASKLGGLSIPSGWSAAADGGIRAAPVLPPTSVASPAMAQASAMPNSPFGQALMGALSGRGLGSFAGKVPAKILPRSPAGG
ncbi:PPE family protein [Mycobacterium helveticum]|uniref:PPE family protein n=2 Tax=Mycobacterium helveticum TaxID=2592811 RepID=A0A557XYE2_9MYCO|nr:PPE family protein [Mycobacterium helveticum]TVS87453.1 PPE family protein [Mycobacterium helveticum]TVS91193.1 PPE family protein [Mycobacterium helveticum]